MAKPSGNRVVWGLVWLCTRALVVAQVGFWNRFTHAQLQDVYLFHAWSDHLATQHAMPVGGAWQYPPGAAALMLLPRVGGADFGWSFVVTMLLFDLLGLVLVAVLARRERRKVGVWAWLLALPLLHALSVLRFDLVPTVIGIAALLVVQRRPFWFGALAGLGAMVKVWPVVVLLAEWDRRRLGRALMGAAGAALLVLAAAWLAFGDQAGFLTNQSLRGLQTEAVAASPWHLWQVVAGHGPSLIYRNGTDEIDSSLATSIAHMLDGLALVVLVAAAGWWLLRDQAIRRGRIELTDPAVGRDVVFAVVLLLVVTSRVLSPQFMIWLLGMAAVVLTSGGTRLARPAWIVMGAVALTAGLSRSPANLVVRNVALVVATIDASLAMARLVGRDERGAVRAGPPIAEALTRSRA